MLPLPAHRFAESRMPEVDDLATELPLQFSGSGSEYFRIWIVNLLLTVVTLGLYWPFAKSRRLAYFLGNTRVGGQPLAWHGNPWKMLRGFLLVGALTVLYGVSGKVSPLAQAVAGLALGLLWPALWCASMRFRLAHTSWRGLRLRFAGTMGGAYATFLPALLAGASVGALFGLGGALAASSPSRAAGLMAVAGLLTLGLMGLAVPWLTARVRRYQHDHYRYCAEATRLELGTGAFFALYFRGGLLALGPGLLLLVAVAASFVGDAGDAAGRLPPDGVMRRALMFMGALLAGWLLVVVPLNAWYQARLQDLVWGHTRSQRIAFASRLGARRLAGLALKNLLLTLLTLGLYWPFARVATARMRLEAVTLTVRGDIAQWSSPQAAPSADASGEAAGDLLGIDLGL